MRWLGAHGTHGHMDAEELGARESIRDLVARYNVAGDAGDTDALAQLFAEDAVMDVEGARYHGRAAVRAMFEAVAHTTAGERLTAHVRHFTATHQIDITGPDTAAGRAYYQTLTDDGLDHWGRYVDRYARRGDRWVFVERRVTVDGMVAGGWCDRMRSQAERGA